MIGVWQAWESVGVKGLIQIVSEGEERGSKPIETFLPQQQ